MKALPPRPEKDFRISSVQWWLDIVDTHTSAGFEPVPREVIVRRFFQFIELLQRKKLTARTIVRSLAEMDDSVELRNFDLTDLGYRFTQRYEPKWVDRLYKDQGPEKEEAFLEKWWLKFTSEMGAESQQSR
jgi:hypothetical protein